MKRIFIIHGWDGNPKNHWFPWLKKELEKLNFEVIIPKMPDTKNPKINSWVDYLKKVVDKVNQETFFVGHSIGCQAIMRYLEKIGDKIGGCVFVAGFFNLPFLETEEEKKIAKPWLKTPINTNKIKRLTKNITAIFSDNDPDVSLDDSNLFKQKLNAKIIIEKRKGHFCLGDGVDRLPSILEAIRGML